MAQKLAVQQFSVPLATRTPGTYGPFASGNLPSNLVGYSLAFVNDATWPTDGSNVLLVTVEQSNDAGNTWAFDASINLTADPWTDRAGNVIHTANWNVGLDNQGSTTRRVRATFQLFQTATLGVTVSSM